MTSKETSDYLAPYRNRIMGSKFFMDDVSEMSREDLLGLLGWMSADKESTVKRRDDHIAFMHKVNRLR